MDDMHPCSIRHWGEFLLKIKVYVGFMKKFLQRLAVSVIILLAAPFVLLTTLQAVSFAGFYIFPREVNTEACTHYYKGVNKGTVWRRGEWHHYVEFKVDDSTSIHFWEVTDAPLPSSLWRDSSSLSFGSIRVGYRWPSNWWDPFPASLWKICLLSS